MRPRKSANHPSSRNEHLPAEKAPRRVVTLLFGLIDARCVETAMNWFFHALKKYAVFSGRASRREFWWFSILAYIPPAIGQVMMRAMVDTAGEFKDKGNEVIGVLVGIVLVIGIATVLYALVMLLPQLAVQVRRLHDINLSGWWLLLGMVPLLGFLFLMVCDFLPGNPDANRFGPPPLGGDRKPQGGPERPLGSGRSVDKLTKLKGLLEAGVITQKDYDQQKAKVLEHL